MLEREVDVLVVGSGPAGASTVLHLLQHDPRWADRITVVDRAVHPREKLCGGGVTHYAQNILANLGLALEPENFPVHEVRVVFRDQSFSFRGNPVFRTVRRAEFDHWLVREVREAGVEVREGETVLDVERFEDHVRVRTDEAVFRARVLVAADGSKSTVRRRLDWGGDTRVARLLEVLTPETDDVPEFQQRTAVFDFSRMTEGLQGYYWDFPSVVDGEPTMNRGVFDSRAQPARPRVDLVGELREAMRERQRDLDDHELKGHPIRRFDWTTPVAQPHVLLAGDAAGADSLFGEGISFALAYGEVAAASIVSAFAEDDFEFIDYHFRVMVHPFLWQLWARNVLAEASYSVDETWVARAMWHFFKLGIRFTPWRNPHFVPTIEPRKRL